MKIAHPLEGWVYSPREIESRQGRKKFPSFVGVLFRPTGLGFILLNTQGGARCTRWPWAIFMRPFGR
jgi:hypothetical protein